MKTGILVYIGLGIQPTVTQHDYKGYQIEWVYSENLLPTLFQLATKYYTSTDLSDINEAAYNALVEIHENAEEVELLLLLESFRKLHPFNY